MTAVKILVTVVLVGLVGVGFYFITASQRDTKKLVGDVYNYQKDPELIRAVEMALSLHAVMSRLTVREEGKDTLPQVRYAIDSVSLVAGNKVEVRYKLIFQFETHTEQREHTKRFRRKSDGSWAATS